jgi:hypothetical protein
MLIERFNTDEPGGSYISLADAMADLAGGGLMQKKFFKQQLPFWSRRELQRAHRQPRHHRRGKYPQEPPG